MPCPGGSVTADCTHCECSSTCTVQVLDNEKLILADVLISPHNSLDTLLAKSAKDGWFTVNNVCTASTYALSKSGYIPLTISGNELLTMTQLFMNKTGIKYFYIFFIWSLNLYDPNC